MGNNVSSAFGVVSVLLAAALCPAVAAAEDFGDVKVLVTVPNPPGSPEGVAVRGNQVFVSGPAKTGTLLNGQPSRVLAFNATNGQLMASYPTQGENLLLEHANSCIAFDGAGRLHVLNTQIGLYRLDPTTGAQTNYSAPFPNLPACGLLAPAPCSPTVLDLPPLPNDLALDPAGNAYVTDSFQATIWRVPPGGGAPQIWFQDQRLASPYIGVNGLRLDPSRTRLYLSVTTDMLGASSIYSLPLVDRPRAADLALFHRFALGDAADGIAFGATGKLYVTLALPTTSGLAVLRPDGSEESRLVNPLLSPTVPYDSPANLAFDGAGSAYVTNHAFATNLPSHFTVLKVFLNDAGWPLELPTLP